MIVRKDAVDKRDNLKNLLVQADTIESVKYYQGQIKILNWFLDEPVHDGFSS